MREIWALFWDIAAGYWWELSYHSRTDVYGAEGRYLLYTWSLYYSITKPRRSNWKISQRPLSLFSARATLCTHVRFHIIFKNADQKLCTRSISEYSIRYGHKLSTSASTNIHIFIIFWATNNLTALQNYVKLKTFSNCHLIRTIPLCKLLSKTWKALKLL